MSDFDPFSFILCFIFVHLLHFGQLANLYFWQFHSFWVISIHFHSFLCFLLVHFIHFHSTYVTRFFLFCLIFVNWAFARLFRSTYFSQTGYWGFKSMFLSCSMTSKEQDSAWLQHSFYSKQKKTIGYYRLEKVLNNTLFVQNT